MIKQILTTAALLMGFSAMATENVDTTTAEHLDIYVAALIGVSSVSNQVNSGPGYGLQAAYYFANPFGAVLFLQGGSHEKGVTSFLVGGQALYNLQVLLQGLQVGALLGLEKFSAGGITGSQSLAYGGKVAYDYRISAQYPISLGIDVSYLLTAKADNIRKTSSNFAILTPLATAKLWF